MGLYGIFVPAGAEACNPNRKLPSVQIPVGVSKFPSLRSVPAISPFLPKFAATFMASVQRSPSLLYSASVPLFDPILSPVMTMICRALWGSFAISSGVVLAVTTGAGTCAGVTTGAFGAVDLETLGFAA